MKLMINRTWRGEVEPTPELEAERMIHAGRFHDRVTVDGVTFPAAPGRYHLYASYACPFSHRVIIVRALKRLQGVVGMSIAHPLWDTRGGWVFGDDPMSTTDQAGNGFLRLHEAYSASRVDYTGKVTVPVLWDAASRRIVNNDSMEIAHILNEAFDTLGGNAGSTSIRRPCVSRLMS
jgi:glutathionyl-hydroquinone reductase